MFLPLYKYMGVPWVDMNSLNLILSKKMLPFQETSNILPWISQVWELRTYYLISPRIGVLSISKLATKINSQRQECVLKELVLRKVSNEHHFLGQSASGEVETAGEFLEVCLANRQLKGRFDTWNSNSNSAQGGDLWWLRWKHFCEMRWGRLVTREIRRINQRRKLKRESFLKYIAEEKTAGRFSERELCYGEE